MRLAPVMFELGARPHPPRELYRAYLEQSDVFVGIYGEQLRLGRARRGGLGPRGRVQPRPGRDAEAHLHQGMPTIASERLKDLIAPHPGGRHASRTSRSRRRRSSPSASPPTSRRCSPSASTARRGADAAPPSPRAARRVPGPYTETIGREADVAAVLELLDGDDVRLVTLVGPGGIGKSRLAIEVALRVADRRRPGRVASCCSSTSSTPRGSSRRSPTSSACATPGRGDARRRHRARARGDRRMLIVLDNFEQVLDAAPAARAAVRRSCRGTTFLVTSRARLRIRGEHVYEVQPLALPDPARGDPCRHRAGLAGGAAVPRPRSGGQSGCSTSPRTTSTPSRGICAALEGVPLALELAAARIRVLSPRSAARAARPAAARCWSPRRATCPTGSAPSRRRSSGASGLLDAEAAGAADPPRCVRRRLQPRRGRGGRRRRGRGGRHALAAHGAHRQQPRALPGRRARCRCSACSRRCGSTRSPSSRRRRMPTRCAGCTRTHYTAARPGDRAAAAGPHAARRPRAAGRRARQPARRGAAPARERRASTRSSRVVWDLFLYWWIRGLMPEARGWMDAILATGIEVSDRTRAIALGFSSWVSLWQERGGVGPRPLRGERRACSARSATADERGARAVLARAGLPGRGPARSRPCRGDRARGARDASRAGCRPSSRWRRSRSGACSSCARDLAAAVRLVRRSARAGGVDRRHVRDDPRDHESRLGGDRAGRPPRRPLRAQPAPRDRLGNVDGAAYAFEGLIAIAVAARRRRARRRRSPARPRPCVS